MKYGVRACTLAMLVILQACSLTACSGQNNNVARTPFPQKSPASSISNDFSKVIPDKKFAACLVSVLNASNKGFPSVNFSRRTAAFYRIDLTGFERVQISKRTTTD